MKLLGHYIHNLGADGGCSQRSDMPAGSSPDENSAAWMLGWQAQWRKLTLRYAYAVIEADAVPWWLSDASFGNGLADTDIKGHCLKLRYALSKRLSFDCAAYLAERKESDTANRKSQVYDFDINYRF
jgi:hypothetical protein